MNSPIIALFGLLSSLSAQAALPLVPLPASVRELPGPGFLLTGETRLVAAAGEAAREAEELAATLRRGTGLPLPVAADGAGIALRLDPALRDRLGPEGYLLESSPQGVKLSAAEPAGLFYAGRTLLQLLPAEVLAGAPAPGVAWAVPAVVIEDRPRFGWRGFMLDEARHFFGMEHVKKTLDAMALHKLNRFHWHLTDDEGWRVASEAYPRLTGVGAWRGTDCALPNRFGESHQRYGGFYTREQLREIVAYAKARHIEIMPEVDLPGHSLAIVTAYPELLAATKGGGESAQGFRSNAVSPANEETYRFVERVFDELAEVFPFEYIHIGGDEVNHKAWEGCPQVEELMRREKLANLHEVQVYFTRRLEAIFAARNKRIFGWNEVLDGRLSRATGIMSWIGTSPGYQAAKMGFPVVMAPGPHAYFDMSYPGAQGEPKAHWWAGPVSSERVYAFDPLGDGGNLPEDAKARILGVHSALWTEFVVPWKGEALELATPSAAADYKIWPRLAALSEVAWTPQERRDFTDYQQRMGTAALRRLELLGVCFRIPVPTASHKAGVVTIHPPFPGAEVRYTLDGSLPTAASPVFTAPIGLEGKDPAKLRARTFLGGRGSTVLAGSQPEGAAHWNPELLAKADGTLDLDVSTDLTSPGIWRATFLFTGGNHALDITGAELLVNGRIVASDPHPGRAGGQHRANTWRFVVPDLPAAAKVILRAKARGDGGANSRGTVTLAKSDRLEPAATVACRHGGHGPHTPDMAADWDDATHFWIAAYPQTGDTVTWTFADPVPAVSAGVLTGERGATKDQAVGAVLEYSTDGATWTELAAYAYGHAEGKLPPGTALKALRVRFTANQATWVIVHDPVLK